MQIAQLVYIHPSYPHEAKMKRIPPADVKVAHDPWVRRFHPNNDASIRLACFPHAGGSASYYFNVSRALASDCDVLSIQYPGRQDRRFETPLESVTKLADGAAAAIALWNDRPLLLFGHSLGATLAYEVAQRLRDSSDIRTIFVSGRRAPSHHRTNEFVHRQSEQRLLETLRQMNGTAPLLLQDPEMVSALLPALRSDYRAAETYRDPKHPPLDVPIVTLNGSQDPEVTAEEIEAWQTHSTLPVEHHWFDGGHFYLNDHANEVIDLIYANVRAIN